MLDSQVRFLYLVGAVVLGLAGATALGKGYYIVAGHLIVAATWLFYLRVKI